MIKKTTSDIIKDIPGRSLNHHRIIEGYAKTQHFNKRSLQRSSPHNSNVNATGSDIQQVEVINSSFNPVYVKQTD